MGPIRVRGVMRLCGGVGVIRLCRIIPPIIEN